MRAGVHVCTDFLREKFDELLDSVKLREAPHRWMEWPWAPLPADAPRAVEKGVPPAQLETPYCKACTAGEMEIEWSGRMLERPDDDPHAGGGAASAEGAAAGAEAALWSAESGVVMGYQVEVADVNPLFGQGLWRSVHRGKVSAGNHIVLRRLPRSVSAVAVRLRGYNKFGRGEWSEVARLALAPIRPPEQVEIEELPAACAPETRAAPCPARPHCDCETPHGPVRTSACGAARPRPARPACRRLPPAAGLSTSSERERASPLPPQWPAPGAQSDSPRHRHACAPLHPPAGVDVDLGGLAAFKEGIDPGAQLREKEALLHSLFANRNVIKVAFVYYAVRYAAPSGPPRGRPFCALRPRLGCATFSASRDRVSASRDRARACCAPRSPPPSRLMRMRPRVRLAQLAGVSDVEDDPSTMSMLQFTNFAHGARLLDSKGLNSVSDIDLVFLRAARPLPPLGHDGPALAEAVESSGVPINKAWKKAKAKGLAAFKLGIQQVDRRMQRRPRTQCRDALAPNADTPAPPPPPRPAPLPRPAAPSSTDAVRPQSGRCRWWPRSRAPTS